MTKVQRTLQNLRSILTNEQTEIVKAASLLMIPSLLSKLTGQVYLMLTATVLGSGAEINDFQIANTIPEMLANILILGVIGAVIIPVLIDSKEKEGERSFFRVFNTILNISLGIFLVATVLMLLFGDQTFAWIIDNLVKPDTWSGDLPNVIAMMKFLMLPNLILGFSVFLSSGLNVYNRFLVPQLAPLFYNVGRIISVIVLLPIMNNSPWALVWGVVIGSVIHLAVQVPLAKMLKFRYEFVLDVTNQYVRKLFKIAIPRTFSFGAEQIGFAVTKLIASGVGKISHFINANSLALVIPSLFGYSFAVASYPTLSMLYTNKRFEEINQIVVKTVNHIVFLSMPFTMAFIILRLPIVRLSFGIFPGTAFNWEDTVTVAWILLFFSLGVIFTSAKWYLYRVFYVAKDTLTPLFIAIISLVVTLVGSIAFSNLLSHEVDFSISHISLNPEHLFTFAGGAPAIGGAALAISFASFVEFILLLVLINMRILKLDFRGMLAGLTKKLVPTVAMTAVMYFTYKTWDILNFPIDATPGFTGSTTINLFVLTAITVSSSFLVYYLLCFLFQVEELKILRRVLNPLFRLGGLVIE